MKLLIVILLSSQQAVANVVLCRITDRIVIETYPEKLYETN